MSASLFLLLPEAALAALALALLVLDLTLDRRHSRALYHAAVLSTGVVLAMVGMFSSREMFTTPEMLGAAPLWVLDPAGLFFKVLILIATLLALLMSYDYKGLPSSHHGSFVALVLWSTTGMMLLSSSVDLLMLFLSLELVSISSFILAGFERSNVKSSEGAIKYFLIGAFSSALTVYGISLFYGATGTTNLLTASGSGPMYVLSLLLILIGLGFKVSMAPFHFWVPDAYEGAPTPVTAYLSVAPKIATMAALLRVFTVLVPRSRVDLTLLLSLLAALTMTIGNLTALFQGNVKRLLAYSSIAQAGYMLIGLVVADPMGQEGVLMYSLAYVAMNIGAFAVAIIVANSERSYELEAFDGLAQRNLGLSLLMAFFMLSLAGIPPLAGFIGKFYIFAAAVRGGFMPLAIVGVLNSVVSVAYYMRITYRMFFVSPRNTAPVPVEAFLGGTLALTSIAIFVIGIFPHPFIESVRLSTRFLP